MGGVSSPAGAVLPPPSPNQFPLNQGGIETVKAKAAKKVAKPTPTIVAKGDALKRQIADLESESAPAPDPVELISLSQQWRQGDAAQKCAVLSALWERIEIRNPTW